MTDVYDVEMVLGDDVTITVRVEADHPATAAAMAKIRLLPVLRPEVRYEFNSIMRIK